MKYRTLEEMNEEIIEKRAKVKLEKDILICKYNDLQKFDRKIKPIEGTKYKDILEEFEATKLDIKGTLAESLKTLDEELDSIYDLANTHFCPNCNMEKNTSNYCEICGTKIINKSFKSIEGSKKKKDKKKGKIKTIFTECRDNDVDCGKELGIWAILHYLICFLIIFYYIEYSPLRTIFIILSFLNIYLIQLKYFKILAYLIDCILIASWCILWATIEEYASCMELWLFVLYVGEICRIICLDGDKSIAWLIDMSD